MATVTWAKGKTMARMIDAEALAKAFAEFLAKSYFGLLRTPTWDDAMDVFCEAPKIDAVEVVRCKDCKFYNPHIRECEGFGKWFGLEDEWGDNDFCSRGERKDGGENG